MHITNVLCFFTNKRLFEFRSRRSCPESSRNMANQCASKVQLTNLRTHHTFHRGTQFSALLLNRYLKIVPCVPVQKESLHQNIFFKIKNICEFTASTRA